MLGRLFLLVGFITMNVNAAPVGIDKVVYGDDDRVFTHKTPLRKYRILAKSTAGMISNSKFGARGRDSRGFYSVLKTKTLGAGMRLCKSERFYNVKTAPNCSGFLVGPDLLVTAGHCMKSSFDCSSNSWVFDYTQRAASKKTIKIRDHKVFKCKEIIKQTLDRNSKNDFALIRLDRKVRGRRPLKLRTRGRIKNNEKLVVIGHPSGLPTIIADNANVRVNNHNDVFFQTNLDTFGGNSGSAVFNARTGKVEGILVRGETDYTYDFNEGCRKVNKCKSNECRGEDVTRIAEVLKFIKMAKISRR